MMNFMDALKSMSEGKRVIRNGWVGFYLTILYGQNYICVVGKGSMTDTGVSTYTPSVEDLSASDWLVKLTKDS